MIKSVENKSQRLYWQSTEKTFRWWISTMRADIWDLMSQETVGDMRATKEVVRQKITDARDLIKWYFLTPVPTTELFTSKGMGVFRFWAAG